MGGDTPFGRGRPYLFQTGLAVIIVIKREQGMMAEDGNTPVVHAWLFTMKGCKLWMEGGREGW